jgi:hypothetical protein
MSKALRQVLSPCLTPVGKRQLPASARASFHFQPRLPPSVRRQLSDVAYFKEGRRRRREDDAVEL